MLEDHQAQNKPQTVKKVHRLLKINTLCHILELNTKSVRGPEKILKYSKYSIHILKTMKENAHWLMY